MVIIGIVFMKATPTSSKSMFYQACSAGSSIVKTQISVWKRDIGLMFGNPGKTTGKSQYTYVVTQFSHAYNTWNITSFNTLFNFPSGDLLSHVARATFISVELSSLVSKHGRNNITFKLYLVITRRDVTNHLKLKALQYDFVV